MAQGGKMRIQGWEGSWEGFLGSVLVLSPGGRMSQCRQKDDARREFLAEETVSKGTVV